MSTNDSMLDKIISDIARCDQKKRKAESEITFYNSEAEKANKELKYFRDEMNQLDQEYSRLLEAERRRRVEISRENLNAR